MSGAREQLIDIYCAGVAGANVESLTANAVATVQLERRHRVWVFAFGKAAHGMAAAAVSSLQRSLAEIVGGLIVAPQPSDVPTGAIHCMAGNHPIPGPDSFAAAGKLQQIVSQKRGADFGIVLLSGGASSLIGAPLRGMGQADLRQLYEVLLGSGLDIAQMNAVRKRFSYWAAGRMALGLAPARTFCFALSDVPGDDLATIGSGPCVPDPTRVSQVIALLEQAGLMTRISASFRQYLADAARGLIPETPKPAHPAFAHVTARVIGNNANALEAAAATARRLGLVALIGEEPLAGDAAATGVRLAETLIANRERTMSDATQCYIWGGETTVTLKPGAPPGGRSQQLALAASKHLAQAGDRGRGITLLVAGTDGRDGTTDCAGAIVNGETWSAIASRGIEPAVALESHDAHRALAAVDATFAPGSTGTNVMDIAIGLVRRV